MNNMEKVLNALAAFDRGLVFFLRFISCTCFTLLLLLMAGNVFARYIHVAAFYWFDEVVEWAFAWMVFFGAAALWARNEHFRLEWINEKLKGTRACHLVSTGLELLSLLFLIIFSYQALRLTMLAKDWTPVFNVSRRWLYVCMPISGVIMVGYSVRNLLSHVRLCTLQPHKGLEADPSNHKEGINDTGQIQP
jgi:TRAP-type C4-dicarboxylate transport system permease small subunit